MKNPSGIERSEKQTDKSAKSERTSVPQRGGLSRGRTSQEETQRRKERAQLLREENRRRRIK